MNNKPLTFHELLRIEINKFNDKHDPHTGRFAPKNGGGGGSIAESTGPYKKDAIAVGVGIDKVRSSVSNEVNSISRESVNIEKIMKEGGCDRATAEKAAAEAKNIFDRMQKVEPQITSDIVSAVAENSGKMYGLDFRMKQETSMARKIAKDANDPTEHFNGDLKASANNIKDACRYTAVFETSGFTDGYKNVKSSLEAKGYEEVRCKNYFTDYKEGTSVQKAVQCVYKDKSGNLLELQFHTFESQGAKEVNHPIYEKSRAASTSKSQKSYYADRMTKISSTVPDPDGVFTIERHK